MKSTLCVTFVGALASAASADLLTFVNTDPTFTLGVYDTINTDDGPSGQWLDITQDVANQPAYGVVGPAWSFAVYYEPGVTSGDGYQRWFSARPSARIAESPTPGVVLDGYTGTPYEVPIPQLFGAGDSIGGTAIWSTRTDIQKNNAEGSWEFLPITSTSFIGIQLTLPDGVHYGFVEVEVYDSSPFGGFQHAYRPISWGYETDVGVPVVIVPAPGAALALLGAGLTTRRRRPLANRATRTQ